MTVFASKSEICMEKVRFREFSQDLRRRGFEEKGREPQGRAKVNAWNSSVLWKSFSGFDVLCGAREDMGSFAREFAAKGGDTSLVPMIVWARFESEGGDGIRMLTHLFSKKSHWVADSQGGRWRSSYMADLVPSADVGDLISASIALDDSLSRLRNDAGYSQGMDAKEVYEALSASVKGVRDANAFKRQVLAGMDSYLRGWWNRYAGELERMRLDTELARSMGRVADR